MEEFTKGINDLRFEVDLFYDIRFLPYMIENIEHFDLIGINEYQTLFYMVSYLSL